MTTSIKLFIAVVLTSAVSILGTLGVSRALEFKKRIGDTKHIEAELRYYKEASALAKYYHTHGYAVNLDVVIETLKTIDLLRPEFFPNDEFSREDFIAIAMLESNFNKYEKGSSGEYGIFQIMPNEFKKDGVKNNQYEIPVNTHYAFKVLQRKFKIHKDYKHSIIAYNGFVKNKKTGKVADRYWKAFLIRHTIIAEAFAEIDK